MVKRPEGIKALKIAFSSLLPIYPPEIHAVLFIGVVKKLKICPSELLVGEIKGNDLLFLGISAKALTHLYVLILKETHAL